MLTDSDAAGFQIRSFLRSICGKENIVDVYIPDLYGKEKRKQHPSREGKLGVEGIPEAVLLEVELLDEEELVSLSEEETAFFSGRSEAI